MKGVLVHSSLWSVYHFFAPKASKKRNHLNEKKMADTF